MIKKIISAAIGAGMIFAASAPVFAAGYSCGNLVTGSGSTNLCNTILGKTFTKTLTNNGTVGHLITKTAFSGYNNANNNTVSTGNWSISAGDASADVTSLASLNTVNGTINQTDSPVDHTGTNNTTGSSSNNTVNIENPKTVNLTVNNLGSISHNITVDSHSGYNNANNNTSIGGGISTGWASNISFVTSILNSHDFTVHQ